MNPKITRIALAFIFVALLITASPAQPANTSAQSSDDRVALYQALLDLQNPWTVMCVAAHPDDEDGTSLIVMRRKYGAHTVSLFSTFGEGGQNAIGPELYEELGAIRARETMAAAEIQGSEPHFLGLKDFGFSKTRDEAFKFWGHEEALRRMVLEIRRLRPDVIITNHSTTSNDHGQHQATALMVVEAFDGAADPNKFPEQLKDGVTTWQVQRLFVRQRGNAQGQANAQVVTIDPNEKDPIRGVVYAEEALRALQQHATQGPWPKTFAEYANRFRAFSGQQGGTPGQLPLIRYALVREAKGATALSAKESHNFLGGFRLSDQSFERINAAVSNPSALLDNKQSVLRTLIGLEREFHHANIRTASLDPRETLMEERLNTALAEAAGIAVEIEPEADVVPGTSVNFVVQVRNRGANRVSVHNLDLEGLGVISKGISAKNIQTAGQTFRSEKKLQIPANIPITVPHANHLYDGRASGEVVTARLSVDVDGESFRATATKRVDVAPPVEIVTVMPAPAAVASDKAPEQSAKIRIPFGITLINHQSVAFSGQLAALDGTFGNPINDMPLKLTADQKRKLTFLVNGPVRHIKNNSIHFLVKDAHWSSPPVDVPIFATGARVAPGLSVGYVRGFDFSLPNALNALGVESKELSVDEVKTADLSRFTSVIVDNRVYESKPELIAENQKLLDYANAGGTLIVFYHKSDEWNPNPQRSRPQLAPYKLILGNERVTDENAPITFIEPDHPLLNSPNKMNQDDFKDWIQERGLYYPREWDPQFHALLQSNDPGEAPLKGGLLVADYGRGHYIYTSMVWYRELRGGVPGAYRMLANMISYGRN